MDLVTVLTLIGATVTVGGAIFGLFIRIGKLIATIEDHGKEIDILRKVAGLPAREDAGCP